MKKMKFPEKEINTRHSPISGREQTQQPGKQVKKIQESVVSRYTSCCLQNWNSYQADV